MFNDASALIDDLKSRGLTLGVVESATGGLISHIITDVPGSSEVFKGAIVAYSNELKLKLVGVQVETLHKYGSVSSQVAEQMAEGGLNLLKVDICIADTGIAGPGGGTGEKPVGLVWVAMASDKGACSRQYIFNYTRVINKQKFALTALGMVEEYLKSTA